jgi:hypothetical protein
MPASDDRPKIRFSTLTNEAAFAFYYALAVVQPQKWERAFLGMRAKSEAEARRAGKHVMTSTEYKSALKKGLEELAAYEIIDVAKDGMGEFMPVQVHGDRVENDSGGYVIAGEGF